MSILDIENACQNSANESLGTTSLAAASCNLSHLDKIANSQELTATNRVGDEQSTIAGLASGYGFIIVGDFSTGFNITSRNQVGQDSNGDIWRYAGSLPFTVAAGSTPTAPNYSQLVQTDHNELTNRNATGSHPASSISTTSGETVEEFTERVGQTVESLTNLSFSDASLINVNTKRTPNMEWGGKGVCILGDSITHGAYSIDIARNNWHSILRRAFMLENEASNYGFVTAVPSIGVGGDLSTDIHEVTVSGFSGQSGADASDSMSGWWYATGTTGATITFLVPAFQKQVAVIYQAAPGNGNFTVSINGNVTSTVDSSVGSGGFFKGGISQLQDRGDGFCEVVVTTISSGTVKISGVMYENETSGYQFNSFAQSGRRLRFTDNSVIDAAITGATTFILALGHNDAFSASDPAYMIEFTARIDRIIATANAQKVKVIVADFAWSQPITNAVRAELKRCADEINGATYMPFPDYLATDGSIYPESELISVLGLFADTSHPNIDGHKYIGETIARQLGLQASSKASGLKATPFWTTVDLGKSGLEGVTSASTDYRTNTAFRLSGNSFNLRFNLWNDTAPIDAGTYPLLIPEEFPDDVRFTVTATYRADNSTDGSTDALIRVREGATGIDLIVINPTSCTGSISIPLG